jgi:hypothetical protein
MIADAERRSSVARVPGLHTGRTRCGHGAVMDADGSHLGDLTSGKPDDRFATWASQNHLIPVKTARRALPTL